LFVRLDITLVMEEPARNVMIMPAVLARDRHLKRVSVHNAMLIKAAVLFATLGIISVVMVLALVVAAALVALGERTHLNHTTVRSVMTIRQNALLVNLVSRPRTKAHVLNVEFPTVSNVIQQRNALFVILVITSMLKAHV